MPISSRFILILSSNLRLGLPKGLFPVGLPTKILKTLLPSFLHSGYMPCPSQYSIFNHPDYIRWTVHDLMPNPHIFYIHIALQTFLSSIYLFLPILFICITPANSSPYDRGGTMTFSKSSFHSHCPAVIELIIVIIVLINKLTNSMAYGTRRFNAAFTRVLQ